MREERKPDKVIAIYHAIEDLVAEGADLSSMRVSDIAAKAGIGKGTTYEYFSSKEEMIMKALIYLVDSMVKRILAQMEDLNSFQDKFMLLLDEMEKKVKQRACIIKYVHMVNDMNLCEQMHDIMIEDTHTNNFSPVKIIRYLIDEGKKEGVISEGHHGTYLETTLFSRIVSFIIYLDGNWGIGRDDCDKMKIDLYQGLCRELKIK